MCYVGYINVLDLWGQVKSRVQFECSECGTIAPKWMGRCTACQAWHSMVECMVSASETKPGQRQSSSEVYHLDQVYEDEAPRLNVGIGEFDRVIGGGLIAGSVILIGGDPGVGKSTLLLQVLVGLARTGVVGLYVTAEESAQQIGLRARRLGLADSSVRLLAENRLAAILHMAEKESLKCLVIDSIQTVYSDLLQSAPGSVAQVRECAAQLVGFAKRKQIAVFLVGHVTKEGALAGPRVLEHMVDTVLYFEGGVDNRNRLVRAVKNRFGAANELGIFAMTEQGLREVSNPSAIFLSRGSVSTAGSAVMVTREGTRPFLVEAQALVDTSQLSEPRRVVVGLEHNRLAMLLAVLHRHAEVATVGKDIYINIVGGVRISETGADLAVMLAILSSLKNQPLSDRLVVFGEVGLSGEIRPVVGGTERLSEAAKHGFTHAIIPRANKPKKAIAGLKCDGVADIQAALTAVSRHIIT